ncbi:MAG: hypothetical protein ACT6FB_03265, partial [Methanosarcinaceae archaeon]
QSSFKQQNSDKSSSKFINVPQKKILHLNYLNAINCSGTRPENLHVPLYKRERASNRSSLFSGYND